MGIGPRLTLELVKIEEEVNSGKVLYHRYVKKTEEEREGNAKVRAEKDELKKQRVVQQELNVRRKAEEEAERATAKLEKRKQREVEKLLKSFEESEDDEGGDKGAQPAQGPPSKKRKL